MNQLIDVVKSKLYGLIVKYKGLYKMLASIHDYYSNLEYRCSLRYRNILKQRIKHVKKIVNTYVKLERKPRENIVIVVIDCLRYRNMSFTSYERKTTPFLDSFKVKLKSISVSPHTYSSVPSILSGMYPHNHGAVIAGVVKNFDNLRNFKLVKNSVITLPEILSALGYDIYFIISIYPLFLPLRNRVIPTIIHGNAEKLLDKAFESIMKSVKSGRSFFVYIHLGDLHEPLDPPKKFRNFFGYVKSLPEIERWAYRRPEEQKGEGFEEYKYNRILLYDNTLRYVDYALEQFYSKLEDKGLTDSTLFIVTADHGEEFWEHAEIEAKFFYDPRGFYGVGHGHNLFNEIIEVPILISGPDTSRIHRAVGIDRLVSTVDIVPTILDWLGLEHRFKLDGYSLLDDVPKDRYILSEAVGYGYEKKALIKGKYKLLYAGHDGVRWVFDLESDPYERKPILKEDIALSLIKELKKILAKDLAYSIRIT